MAKVLEHFKPSYGNYLVKNDFTSEEWGKIITHLNTTYPSSEMVRPLSVSSGLIGFNCNGQLIDAFNLYPKIDTYRVKLADVFGVEYTRQGFLPVSEANRAEVLTRRYTPHQLANMYLQELEARQALSNTVANVQKALTGEK